MVIVLWALPLQDIIPRIPNSVYHELYHFIITYKKPHGTCEITSVSRL
jgi:hypothetical protein